MKKTEKRLTEAQLKQLNKAADRTRERVSKMSRAKKNELERRARARIEGSQYDDLLPVSLYQAMDLRYHLLDRHNDEIALFDPHVEIEDMERIVRYINAGRTENERHQSD